MRNRILTILMNRNEDDNEDLIGKNFETLVFS